MGNLYTPDINAFKDDLVADFTRGRHATGIAAIRGTSVGVLKKAWNPIDLMQHKAYDQLVSSSALCLIGHNRHGTIGDNHDHANAHPFNFPNVVGAHNGTLDRGCLSNLHNSHQFGTDSEALYSEINENGIDEAMSKIGGAWALTFVDKKAKTFNVIRNDQRPLWMARKKGGSVVYWASEEGLLRWITDRNNIDLLDDEVWLLKTNTLVTWECSMTPGNYETRELKGGYEPKSYSSRGSYGWTPERKEDVTTKTDAPFQPATTQQAGTQATQTGSPKTGEVILLPGSSGKGSLSSTDQGDSSTNRKSYVDGWWRRNYKDGKGVAITYSRFQDIIKHNCCAYCGNDNSKYMDNVAFLASFNHSGYPDYLCEECNGDPAITEIAKVCL